ncbi:Lrp/AsnC family transcriptional regulator [Roseivivax sp. CAU 1753]
MPDTRIDLDDTDIRLLAALQQDAHLTAETLGSRLNLSASQAGRRRQRLEKIGAVRAYTAQLDPERLGLAVQAFIQVSLASHGADQARGFARLVATRTEIVSAWTLTGEADYLLRAYAPDLRGLHRLIHDVLLPHPSVARVQSQIVMDQLKADAPLPL